MNAMRLGGWCLVLCLGSLPLWADETPTAEQLQRQARDAVYGCSRSRGGKVAELRRVGPAALDALFALQTEMAAKAPHLRPNDPNRTDDDPTAEELAAVAEHTRRTNILREVIDAVGSQRDCSASGLYWYTDLEAAKAAAMKSQKPILSLRMLGNLTDDLSCANSRFFRTTLYANHQVAEALRNRFVLHWQSVRPVPIVTIDFGDGRKLVRTVTGNSAHYVLDPQGRVVDALPGLYGPRAFLIRIGAAEALVHFLNKYPRHDDWTRAVAAWHAQELERTQQAWRKELQNLETAAAQPARPASPQQAFLQQAAPQQAAPPRAAAAARLARPKQRAERVILAAATLEAAGPPDANTSDELWAKIALAHAADAELDPASRALISSKLPPAGAAGELAVTKAIVEMPLVRVVRSLQQAIALDTVKNEYLLHRKIHEWLAAAPDTALDELNERVYAELFLTPGSDPWLGLLPADGYTALENGGVVAK
ncbi:MAG: hypothetical protein AB7O62_16190 [Pirellulales bacterium]